MFKGFLCGSAGKERACNVGDLGSIPGLGRSPGEGQGYPLQCSGLENSTDCMVHGILKSWSRLSHFHSLTMFKVFCLIKKIKVYDLHYNWRCSINKKSWWIESTNFKIYLWNRFFIMWKQSALFCNQCLWQGRDFPGGPVVKTLRFHFRGHRFNPWLGNNYPICCEAKS